MSENQKELAYALLATGLTDKAYRMARLIMENELLLTESDKKRTRPSRWPLPQGYILDRDPEFYFFTIFGAPSGMEPWGGESRVITYPLTFPLIRAISSAPPLVVSATTQLKSWRDPKKACAYCKGRKTSPWS